MEKGHPKPRKKRKAQMTRRHGYSVLLIKTLFSMGKFF